MSSTSSQYCYKPTDGVSNAANQVNTHVHAHHGMFVYVRKVPSIHSSPAASVRDIDERLQLGTSGNPLVKAALRWEAVREVDGGGERQSCRSAQSDESTQTISAQRST